MRAHCAAVKTGTGWPSIIGRGFLRIGRDQQPDTRRASRPADGVAQPIEKRHPVVAGQQPEIR